MLIKLDLVDAFEQAATRLAPFSFLRQPLLLTVATILFLTIGPGLRLFGIAGTWRAIRGDGRAEGAAWRLTGWCILTAVALPFVVATDPYVDTLQFYQTGLFLLWIVTAMALTRFARRHRVVGTVAICVAVASTLPSSIHYLTRKWTDNQRSPLAALSRGEAVVAGQLATTDPEGTVFLNDSPLAPSLMTIVSGRRTVLAWGHPHYTVGSGPRARDVNSFYGSANATADLAIDVLRRYHVTHVVVHPDAIAFIQACWRFSGRSCSFRMSSCMRFGRSPSPWRNGASVRRRARAGRQHSEAMQRVLESVLEDRGGFVRTEARFVCCAGSAMDRQDSRPGSSSA
jgi:hypothetical protein